MCVSPPKTTEGWAFFLDIDGTLIDIAPTPDSVVVPPALPDVLNRLLVRTGGAVALLTGRSIATVDRLFAPARLPVAAIHGAEIRLPGDDAVVESPVPALEQIRQRLMAFVAAHPDALFEDKGVAVAVHYRAKPELRDLVEAEVKAAAALGRGAFGVQAGKFVFELRPAGASKGRALAVFMEHPNFSARRPLAVGDDVTDETMFAAAQRLGGCALRVGPAENDSVAAEAFASPAAVRDWLDSLVLQ